AGLKVLWSETLGLQNVAETDDFFALGGHSLNAVRMFGQIRRRFGVTLPLATLFEAPTLGALADRVSRECDQARSVDAPSITSLAPEEQPSLVRISQGQAGVAPFFVVHGAGGNVLTFRALAGFLDPRIPFWGLRARGSDGGLQVDRTIEEMAERYLSEIRAVYPTGPYRFGGYSGGGLVAFEMARLLRSQGEEAERVVLFDTLAADAANRQVGVLQKIWSARRWDIRFAMGFIGRQRQARVRMAARGKIESCLRAGERIPEELIGYRLNHAFVEAQRGYRPQPYEGNVTLFRARRAGGAFPTGWSNDRVGRARAGGYRGGRMRMRPLVNDDGTGNRQDRRAIEPSFAWWRLRAANRIGRHSSKRDRGRIGEKLLILGQIPHHLPWVRTGPKALWGRISLCVSTMTVLPIGSGAANWEDWGRTRPRAEFMIRKDSGGYLSGVVTSKVGAPYFGIRQCSGPGIGLQPSAPPPLVKGGGSVARCA
ncbi:MAG: thioesterase domain-containing protein, partial [Pseudomonadota bacterium]